MRNVDPKVEEAIDTLNMKDGPTRRRLLSGAGLASATAAASALLAACSSSSSGSTAKEAAGNFPKTPAWQFWFVNHVYTNSFFVPTQYGFQDAAALLGLPKPNWGGSASTSSVPQMVSYLNNAISAKAGGIATTVINSTGFTKPVGNAMDAGIPVVTYNADGLYKSDGTPVIGTNRLCYVGQALFNSGVQMGNKIKSLVPGGGDIVIFIATPGTGNIQPRYDGAASVLKAGGYTLHEIATGAATSAELPAEKAYLSANKGKIKGAFAVDAGSTSFLAQALAATGLNVPAGGFDLVPQTLKAIQAGHIAFTIDQSPYLQGFLPVLYLYLYNLSGSLVFPPNTDTGLTFVTKDNVGPYLSTSSRFEGSTSQQKYIKRPSGPIKNPIATTST
ncbi:MAG: substrate-binding domain-containing protein [Actinobacteria bacterium]|nr:substrate-binding domain-containing protein [Actinomycetota bacterium]MBO0784541.1 substrate-binding domain-containing protein [Actinomycetota bacterium]